MKKYFNLAFAIILLIISAIIIINNRQASRAGESGTKADTTYLFNGSNLDGWKIVLADTNLIPSDVWMVKDSVIWCRGDFSYLETTAEYTDYFLHVEWKWPGEPTNSGVFLHINGPGNPFPPCIECQLQNGNAGDFITIGGTRIAENNDSTIFVYKMNPSSEKPAGEWNRYDISVVKDSISVLVNDVLQNTATRTSVTSGRIALQGEGGPIEFRNLYIVKK